MKPDKIAKYVEETLREMEQKDLKIAEKIIVLRSAADVLDQIILMETSVLMLQKSLTNIK